MNKFDFETKYITYNSRAMAVRAFLDSYFQADPEYPEAQICSIYFDTLQLNHLNEKINSDHLKSKFRIRWYESLDTARPSANAFLEFKHKVNHKRFKRREMVENKFHDLALEDNYFQNIFQDFRCFDSGILENITPSYLISYTRKRYIDSMSGMRLCIDYNIHLRKINTHLIRRPFRSGYLTNCVFETKGGSKDLISLARPLELFGLKQNAFSKYERCFHEFISEIY